MKVRRLHIGALQSSPGWESLNSQPLEGITHVCDARDLSQFADDTFESVYASHVLEHFDYQNEVSAVLKEWFRVLAPRGQLYISVPDLDTICRLYCDRDRFDVNDRFMMMRMIMGGHCDRYDYHSVAFNQEFLAHYLTEAGFDNVCRIAEFNLFDDTSCHRLKGDLISLNVIAEKSSSIRQPSTSITTSTAADRFIAVSTEKAISMFEAGHFSQAIAFYKEILSAFPDNEEVLLVLAKMYKNFGMTDEALPLLQSIPKESFFFADALFTRGMILMNRRDFAGGADCFTKLVELDNKHTDGYNNLGRCLMELGRPEEAQNYLLKSIQVSPDNSETYLYLGNLFARYWRLGEAREQFQRVIELQQDDAGAYNNLSGIALLEGNIDEALALLRTAMELKPNNRVAADNLLFNMNYSEKYSPEQVRDEHLRLAEVYNVPVKEYAVQKNCVGAKIRVGYVSGDFRSHSVAFFLEPVLRHHDKDNVDIFCYDMVTVPDETTRRMMAYGWTWRTIYGLSDNAVADQVRKDGIDILVDLAGHTLGNRLGVFALRPAPLQVTWLGYPNTTGLHQIDFRLTDEFADPRGMTDHLYSEKLVRLPRSFLCYAPPSSAPEIPPLPDQPVTFCCFNNYPKFSDAVLSLWVRILHAVPDSKLLLKCGSLKDPHVRTLLMGRFIERGIDSSRLILDRFTKHREEHLQRYGACHIALDTFPYNGTTTTCEALWLGVPVITLAGKTHASRVGVSIMENIGLHELVAQNEDQYVQIAVTLAQDWERLLKYRQNLRTQISGSSLTDAVRFTSELEKVYRDLLAESLV